MTSRGEARIVWYASVLKPTGQSTTSPELIADALLTDALTT